MFFRVELQQFHSNGGKDRKGVNKFFAHLLGCHFCANIHCGSYVGWLKVQNLAICSWWKDLVPSILVSSQHLCTYICSMCIHRVYIMYLSSQQSIIYLFVIICAFTYVGVDIYICLYKWYGRIIYHVEFNCSYMQVHTFSSKTDRYPPILPFIAAARLYKQAIQRARGLQSVRAIKNRSAHDSREPLFSRKPTKDFPMNSWFCFLLFSIFQHWQHWHRFLLDPDPFGKNRRNWGVGNMDLRKWLNIFRLAKHKMNTWFTTIDEQYRKTAKKAWNKCRHEGTGFHLFGGYFND